MTIRAASENERKLLGELALRSKAVWGYSPAFLAACREELQLRAENLGSTFLKEVDGHIVGFYSLSRVSAERVELDHLFVEPAVLRRGYGRALLRHAAACATAAGYRLMVIQSDPGAAGFYVAAGAMVIGERESGSVAGRFLPLLEMALDLAPYDHANAFAEK